MFSALWPLHVLKHLHLGSETELNVWYKTVVISLMQHKWKKMNKNNQFDVQETKGSPAEKNDLSDEANSLTQRFKFKRNVV